MAFQQSDRPEMSEPSKIDSEKAKGDADQVDIYEREIKDERELGELHRQLKSR